MKRSSPRLIALALLILAVSGGRPAFAVENSAGIFAIGSSARGQGIGGAFSALADDEGAVFHSPAALGWQEGFGISSHFVQQFGGTVFGSIGLAAPCAGVNLFILDSGAIPSERGSTRYASQGVAVSLGIPIGMIGIGARWRFFRMSAPSTGSGWALDPAILAVTDSVRVSLMYEGAASSPITYQSGTQEVWERSLRLGVALTLEPTGGVGWNASVEASGLFAHSVNLAAGLEAWIGALGARVGFDGHGPTFGLSLLFPTLQIDWAFAARDDLGNSHRVAMALRF